MLSYIVLNRKISLIRSAIKDEEFQKLNERFLLVQNFIQFCTKATFFDCMMMSYVQTICIINKKCKIAGHLMLFCLFVKMANSPPTPNFSTKKYIVFHELYRKKYSHNLNTKHIAPGSGRFKEQNNMKHISSDQMSVTWYALKEKYGQFTPFYHKVEQK